MHPRHSTEGALQGISFTPTPSSLHSSIAGLTARFCQATHTDDMEGDIKVSVAATRLCSAVLEANYRCYNDELLAFLRKRSWHLGSVWQVLSQQPFRASDTDLRRAENTLASIEDGRRWRMAGSC
jgi:hypothetical protein